jgi:hypothetical protein
MPVLAECPIKFTEIKLIWRPAPHTSRMVVGSLRKKGASFSFVYDGSDLNAAMEQGFRGYPGMGDFGREYNGQAMASFASRLPGRERPDFENLISGWDGRPEMSDFELLGVTNGRLPTDMFEFIPMIEPVAGATFVTDLAGVQHYAASEAFRNLPQGTELTLRHDRENSYDTHAVEVLNDGQRVAYVKRVHSDSICGAIGAGLQVICTLERVRLNGVIRDVIVRIRFE